MEFIMDMVHHNPGEAPFETNFLKPEKLREYGYNAQVFKHINTAVNFLKYDEHLFDESPEAMEWIKCLKEKIRKEIQKAKTEGLKVYYHIDLFVLPKAVYEKYKDEICDDDGRISIYREKTKELHRAMFDEIFEEFSIDGLIIRVGETYLHDTPYHMGNGAVKYGDVKHEQEEFISLLQFLRTEVCEKHNKYIFFRTWDCFPDKFHADLDYYLSVTDRVETHPKLIFSIKHTALDFWRRVKFNECLGQGKHRQIVEIQCQREYEGKGAYPMYIMNGVINSFCENEHPKGLRDIADNPLICGVYTWSRGGGWYGPYIKNEFWCDLNAYVISKYASDTRFSEEEIFYDYAVKKMKLSQADSKIWRELCMMTSMATLKGRYAECYDRTLNESVMPCANYMRDDRIGGLRQLKDVFDYLFDKDLLTETLIEKKESCFLWGEARQLFDKITVPDRELSEFIKTSIDYGLLLYNVVYAAWKVMTVGYVGERRGNMDYDVLRAAIEEFDTAWNKYCDLENNNYASSLYKNEYLTQPGIGETVEYFRRQI